MGNVQPFAQVVQDLVGELLTAICDQSTWHRGFTNYLLKDGGGHSIGSLSSEWDQPEVPRGAVHNGKNILETSMTSG